MTRQAPRALAALLGTLSAVAAARVHAQAPAPRTAAYLFLRGTDTLAVERVRRTAGSVSAVVAAPSQPRVEIAFTLAPDHTIPGVNLAVRGPNAPPDAAPLQVVTAAFGGDSVTLHVRAGAQQRDLRVPTRAGALPITNNDLVVVEQLVRIARASGVRSLTRPLFLLAGGQTLDGRLELIGSDSARFTVATSTMVVAVDAAGDVTGGGVPSAGLRIAVVTGAAAEAVELGRPDYSAPAGAPYTAEEVRVPTPAGHALGGTLTRPGGAAGRAPAVITITGSGAQDRDEFVPFAGGVRIFRQVADTLSRRGIAVLRLDDRGVGSSGGDVNGTTADFADDIRAAVDWLRARPDIDGDRIALVGHSEGGAIAPMVAATDPRLAAIVLMAGPARSGRAILDFQLDNLVRGDSTIPAAAKDSAVAASRAAFDSTAGRAPWMRWFLAYDPLPTVRRVRQPVLILQGETDQQVRADEARMLEGALREAGNARVTTHVFPARNHLFLRDPVGHPRGYDRLPSNRVDAEVLGTLADWLAATLRAP